MARNCSLTTTLPFYFVYKKIKKKKRIKRKESKRDVKSFNTVPQSGEEGNIIRKEKKKKKIKNTAMRTLCTATDLIPTIPKVGICNHSPPLPLKFPSFLQYSAIPSKRLHRGIAVKASSMASTPSTVPDGDSQTNKPFSVLFVCLGNICRSPAAEGVFKHLVNQKNLHSKFYIDSAGTINYHEVRVSVFFFFFSLVHV